MMILMADSLCMIRPANAAQSAMRNASDPKASDVRSAAVLNRPALILAVVSFFFAFFGILTCVFSGRAKGKASARRPTTAPKNRVASSRGSEPPITISEGEDMPSASRISKAKPVVLLQGRKRKLADVEEEDFALADSGLRGDDLVMAGKLRGVYAKFRTIQGLMSEVANELDMMRVHLNKKARS